MKTIRVSYLSSVDATAEMESFFTLNGVKDNPESKTSGIYGHFLSDTLVDMLVPDDFDPSVIVDGTIVKSDGVEPIHEWLGHDSTPMAVDKAGKTETPVKEESTETIIK